MTGKFEMASISILARLKPIPDLLRIDREIGVPYLALPRLLNSQAWSRRVELPWTLTEIGPTSAVTILDVGSGVSSLPVFLARNGARVISVDPKPANLPNEERITRIRAALPNLPFRDHS